MVNWQEIIQDLEHHAKSDDPAAIVDDLNRSLIWGPVFIAELDNKSIIYFASFGKYFKHTDMWWDEATKVTKVWCEFN
jgi:uncharacterized membrane protein YGL010W